MKIGDCVAARFRVAEGLSNGDIIVAKITGIGGGRAVLVNLVTKKTHHKALQTLKRRNHVVTKKDAERIVTEYDVNGKHAARELAVSLRKKDA